MKLNIVTPDKTIFEGEVLSSTFPGAGGAFQVLNNHAPIISALESGVLSYNTSTGENSSIKISGGVVEVSNNTIIVLVESILV